MGNRTNFTSTITHEQPRLCEYYGASHTLRNVVVRVHPSIYTTIYDWSIELRSSSLIHCKVPSGKDIAPHVLEVDDDARMRMRIESLWSIVKCDNIYV